MDFGFIFSSAAGELFSPTTAAYALATLGLAVHFGYTGLLNFGQAGFMAVGAYGFAISTLTFHVPFFVGLLIAVVGSAIFALLLGIPTLRLRADYLAIVTIAAAEIIALHRHDQPADRRHRFGQRPGRLRRRLLRHEPLPAGDLPSA